MRRTYQALVLATSLGLMTESSHAKESIEFVAEHLPEIAMDNRYASLPLWNSCDGNRRTSDALCYGLSLGYARTHSGTLSFDGSMLSLSAAWSLSGRYRLAGFVFLDDYSLTGGVEHRPLDTLFVDAPLVQPVNAEFTGLDGSARHAGFGVVLEGSANWSWLPSFEWSAGLMWQQFELRDYRFDYLILDGPDAGVTGTVDYSARYAHIAPVVGAAWPRVNGAWRYIPHLQLAMPLPRRGVEGRITGPTFDLKGYTADNGTGTPFGDPSVTIGFNVTYLPWHITVDLGSTITQALIEPKIHEGVHHNLLLIAHWTF